MDKITVVAMQGCICPRERLGEPVITDCEPVTVKQTPFYTRLIADGSLRIYKEQKAAPAPKKTSEKTDKTGGNK
jgi:hypothetical protein